MDTGTDSDVDGMVDDYWRRRVIVLGGLLALVGLLAWACSGGDDAERRPAAGAATESASPASPTPTPSVLPTVTVTKRVTVTPSPVRKDGDACDKADVVVDLRTDTETYGGGRRPELRLSVVNTGERSCTFDVGPGGLRVEISSGSDRVWTSAHCPSGSSSSIQLLRRGVPHLTTITWDRRRSSADCGADRPAALPGTYTVLAESSGRRRDRVASERTVFRLR